jgi:hypothetical protein
VQPADDITYSEPTFVGVQKFPMQQEQAQLSVLELEPLLALVVAAIRVQAVDPEVRVFFPLIQAIQPPPLPSVSRPLGLYVLIGQFATQNVAPGDEVLPELQGVQSLPAPSLSRPLELNLFCGHGRVLLQDVAPGEERAEA